MPRFREKQNVEDPVVRWAYKTYGDAFKKPLGRIMSRKLNGLGARSWPDRMFVGLVMLGNLKRGRGTALGPVIFFIEFKKPGAEPEPLQDHMLRTLRRLGFRAYVADNQEVGREIITAEMEGQHDKVAKHLYWKEVS